MRPEKHRRGFNPYGKQSFGSRKLIRVVQTCRKHHNERKARATQNAYADEMKLVIVLQALRECRPSNHPVVDITTYPRVPAEFGDEGAIDAKILARYAQTCHALYEPSCPEKTP